MDFIYDDGTMENGWASSPGTNGWFGNAFPVMGMAGTIQSISSNWWTAPCGPQNMTIDIFDGNRNLVATTQTFVIPDGGWVTVPVNNVPFSGPFYAMAHFIPASICNYWLGDDENGPDASQDLAWFTDGTTWQKVSSFPNGNPGVFLMRVTANITDGGKMADLLPGAQRKSIETSDSMVIAGYNVYRKPPSDDSSFIKVNTNPVTVTEYTDVLPSNNYFHDYYYFVTCIYNMASTNNFLCESMGSDTVFESLVINIGENSNISRLNVFPVPASTLVRIQSDKIITGFEMDDHLGATIVSEGNLHKNEYSIPVSRLSPGLYFLKVMTGQDIIIRKILVVH